MYLNNTSNWHFVQRQQHLTPNIYCVWALCGKGFHLVCVMVNIIGVVTHKHPSNESLLRDWARVDLAHACTLAVWNSQRLFSFWKKHKVALKSSKNQTLVFFFLHFKNTFRNFYIEVILTQVKDVFRQNMKQDSVTVLSQVPYCFYKHKYNKRHQYPVNHVYYY